MQSAPPEIQDHLEEEPIPLSEDTLAGEAGVKSEETKLSSPAPQKPRELGTAVALSSLEVELLFVLGQQSISLEDLRSLAEEKIIPLGGSDFQASILLQGKKIAEAQLVMVDKTPSLQITRIIAAQ